MPYELTGINETPEELEIRRRQSTMQRIRALSIVTVLCIVARLLIKNPPPRKEPDRSKRTIHYVPGMIEDIPLDRLKKMDPKLVAAMRAAEAKYKEEQALKSIPTSEKGLYKAAEIPVTKNAELEALK